MRMQHHRQREPRDNDGWRRLREDEDGWRGLEVGEYWEKITMGGAGCMGINWGKA